MKNKSVFIYALAILLSISSGLWSPIKAQETKPIINASLVGTVIDADTKEPIEGATIQLEAVTHSVKTDRQGKFQFVTGQKLPFTATISYVGYESQTIVFKTSPAVVELKPKSNGLDEVVVVGYGTQKRKDVIGAVSNVDVKNISKQPVSSFDGQLQGQVSGVQVNAYSGTPGEGIKVRLRGVSSINASNEPLYVIDGLQINSESLTSINLGNKKTSPLADINPADIESIDVLKDASAIAIYGSRGANGVVLVTTKRGKYGVSRPRYQVDYSQGAQWLDKDRLWDLTSGPEHATIVNEVWINSGIDNPALNQNYNNRPFRPTNEVINGVAGRGNPEDQITEDRLGRGLQTAGIKDFTLSVLGGSEVSKYNFAFGYTNQEGVLKPVKFERGNFKINLDNKLNDKLTLSSSNNGTYSFRQQARAGSGQEASYMLAILHHPTYLPLYNSDGKKLRGSIYENVDNLIDLDVTNISTRSIRYLGNQFLEYKIIPGLTLRSSVGLDFNLYNEREYFNNETIIGGAPNPEGYRKDAITYNTIIQNEQLLTYDKSFSKSHINVLLGNTLQFTKRSFNALVGRGFPNNSYQEISAASIRTADQSKSQSNLASVFGRLSYNYDTKYYAEVSLRADGSSKFGPNNRWGYFPALGLAWRLKNEKFLKDNTVISELKLRGSIGLAGNQGGIGDYAWRGLWKGNEVYYDDMTGTPKPATAPTQLSNPDLKWERTLTNNLGLDVGLYNNRIVFDLNAYHKYTSDALLEVRTPRSTGFSSTLVNAGEISNKGIEFNINTVNVDHQDFSWRSSFNIAHNINRAEKLDAPITFEAREYRLTQEGIPLGSWWLYDQLYVDPQTGDAVFDDLNEDGKLTTADRKVMGSLEPKFFGGLTNDFNYKNFSLNVLFTYQYGNKIYDFNKYILEGGGTRDASRSILASQLDYWKKPGDITNTPRLTSVGPNYTIEQNSRYLSDGSYVRLKNITLTYSLPKDITEKLKLSRARIYAQASNLFIWTNYSGVDPESSNESRQNLDGLDTATVPQPIGFQAGINFNF